MATTCPLDQQCLLGNCVFCPQNADCVLLAILKKLEGIEAVIQKPS